MTETRFNYLIGEVSEALRNSGKIDNQEIRIEMRFFSGSNVNNYVYTGKELLSEFKEPTVGGYTFYVYCGKITPISRFVLMQLPGCCGILLSTSNFIYSDYRGLGLNNILNELRKEIAKDAGYTILMCTDVANNVPQKKTLLRNGWQDIFRFRNKRTNNLVDISVVQL